MKIKKTDEEINKCLEYVEDKDKFKEVIKDIKVFISKPQLKSHFEDDKEKGIYRNIYRVTIQRESNKISFMYGDSINNTEANKTPDLYSVLACVGSDYYCPDDFEDFCGDYGYDEDSRKAEKLHKRCLKQSDKLKEIFTEEEAQNLPR